MIVTYRPPGLLPDLLLRVQVRGSGREFHNVQVRVGGQDFPDGCASMPGGPVPKQDHAFARMAGQDLLEVLGGRRGVELAGAGDELLARAQVQAAIESDFAAPRVHPHHWRFADRVPDRHQRGLQIHPGFIFGQVDRVRVVLG